MPRLLFIGLSLVLLLRNGPPALAHDTTHQAGSIHRVITTAPNHITTETYDRTGALTEVTIDDQHEHTTIRYVFTYDHRGRAQEEMGFDSTGTQLYRKVFAYTEDARERTTGEVAATDEGAFHHAQFSSYDNRNNVSDTLVIDRAQTARNLFDVLGRLIYSGRFSEGRLAAELLYRYDARGRLSEIISYDPSGRVTGRLLNEYDDQDHRIRAITERASAHGTRHWIMTYDYDEHGNWTKEWLSADPTASSDSELPPPRLLQERIIEYYSAE